jgi:hypothetical protein
MFIVKYWLEIGKNPSEKEALYALCEGILESIGWPTSGLKAALPDAIEALEYWLGNREV